MNKNGTEINIVSSKDTEEEVLQEGDSVGKWEVDKKQQYIDNLDANKVQNLKDNVGNMSIECITSELKNILLDTAKITFPAKSRRTKKSKTRTKRTAPWYTGECRKKRQEYLRARSKNNKQGNDKTKADLLSKSKQYKKEMLKAQREHNKKFKKKLRNMDKNPKLYWNMLQGGKRNKKTSPISIKDFYEHFKQLADDNDNNGNAEDQLKAEDDNSRNELNTSSLNARFDEQEIRKCINKLRNGKSAGIDRIVNEYIKCTADIFMPIYIVLFNKIFDTGTIPEDWVIGLIVPIYKNKGDIADCNNYRGITLLSCMGKLFTSILNARLYKFCEVNNIIKNLKQASEGVTPPSTIFFS